MKMKITQEIRDELSRLYFENDGLTEEAIVTASKVKSSPLHEHFLWDDEAGAAHIGRLEIARHLIMRVKIEPVKAEELQCSPQIRQYVGRVGGGYQDITDVMTQAELRARLEAVVLKDLDSIRLRNQHLHGLAAVFDAIGAEVEKRKPKEQPKTKRKTTKKKSKRRRQPAKV